MKKSRLKKIQNILITELILLAFFMGIFVAMVTHPELSYPEAKTEIAADEGQIKEVAESYLKVAAYSKKGLVEALCEYEHLDRAAVEFVIGTLGTDWQKQADREVQEYLLMDGNSEKRIRDFMKRDLFTEEQIDKAISAADPDWEEQAKMRADILRAAGAGDANIKAELLNRGFTDDQVRNAQN